jgi:outer membrane protein OmpA-like peptidoglycan-associated protein
MNVKIEKMKSIFRLLPILGITFSLFAQDVDNLVPNGSFEQISEKPRRLGGIEAAEGWISTTGVSADLFSSSADSPDIQVPQNFYGKEDAVEGSNYAGIVVFSYGDKMPRSYIASKLSTPMKKGMRYKVTFRASLAELSKYSSNKLAAHISKKPFETKEKVPALIEKSHIMHPQEIIFNAMYGWEMICGEYIAEGGERYITIGNFTPNDQVKDEKNKKPRELKGNQIVGAYYYIDDVSVNLLDPDEMCDCGYSDDAEKIVSTVYQRTVSLTDNMTLAQKLEVQNVFYGKGRYDIAMAGDKTLNLVANLLAENPDATITVSGHGDVEEIQGGEFPDISMKRAEYIRSLLVNKDVDVNRIKIADAKNNTRAPFAEEGDDEQLQNAKERRVSFALN